MSQKIRDTDTRGYDAQPPPYEEPENNSSPFQGIHLSAHGLEICAQESIDLSVLQMLTSEEMQMLAFRFGDRKKIQAWQAEQRKPTPSATTKTSTSSTDTATVSGRVQGLCEMPSLNPSYQPSAPEESDSEAQAGQRDQQYSDKTPHERTLAFLKAVEEGDEKSVEALLRSEGVDFGVKNAYGMGAVHIAAQKGRADIMRLFLACNDFDFSEVTEKDNVKSGSGWTALHYANDEKIVQLLLGDDRDRVNVNARNADGLTALALAAHDNKIECVRLFLADGRIDVKNALRAAVQEGHVNVVRMLIADKRTDINAALPEDGCTPLHVASFFVCSYDVLKALLESAGINTNARNKHGDTPLALAASKGLTEHVSILLADKRVDVHAVNASGKTAIALAATFGQHVALRTLLADGRIDLHARANDGSTALQEAASHGHLECVKVLIEFAAKSRRQYTSEAVSIAKEKAKNGGHSEVREFLKSQFPNKRRLILRRIHKVLAT